MSQRSPASGESEEDATRRERLQRVLARLNRIHGPPSTSTTNAAYGDRTPSPTQQRLYDWAPGYEEGTAQDESELDAILHELREQQPETSDDLLRVLGESRMERRRERRERTNHDPLLADAAMTDWRERRSQLYDRERRRRDTESVSLRTRAAMQRARAQDNSPSATERMLRYVMARERSGLSEEEERARGTGWYRTGDSSAERRVSVGDTDSDSIPDLISAEEAERSRDLSTSEMGAFRRSYLAQTVPSTTQRLTPFRTPPPLPAISCLRTPTSTLLENALQYLDALRSATCYEDTVTALIDNDLGTKEFCIDKLDDLVKDLSTLPPVADTSWLQPGAVFDGHQHANNSLFPLTLSHSPGPITAGRATVVTEQINPNYHTIDHPPNSTRLSTPPIREFDAQRPWLSHTFIPPTPSNPAVSMHFSKHAPFASHEQWPVRVTLHTVDPIAMTVQGTMEAYDVPQQPSSSLAALTATTLGRPKAGTATKPITTYLEGQIIDLSTHTFLTPSTPLDPANISRHAAPRRTDTSTLTFPSATPASDAANWLQLPPFSSLSSSPSSADQVARNLLSTTYLSSLNERYIFMRWKERCFVHTSASTCPESERYSGDQDRGHGLTISGFYYVSLERATGEVEGLYFDPRSTPFQRLKLKGLARGWGSVGVV